MKIIFTHVIQEEKALMPLAYAADKETAEIIRKALQEEWPSDTYYVLEA